MTQATVEKGDRHLAGAFFFQRAPGTARSQSQFSTARRGGRCVAWLLCGVLLPIAGGQTSQPQSVPASEPTTTKANGSTWVPAAVTRTDTGLLDVHVRDMELSTLLEMLSYQARANIVTSTRVTGRVSANLYAVTLEQGLEAILTPNHYAFAADGTTVFVGTPEEIAALRPPPLTRVFKLRYIRPAEAAKAVKAVLGPEAAVVEGAADKDGGQGGGGGSGGGSGGGNSTEMGTASIDYLVVTDYPDRLNAVQKLLAELDQRPKQVLIEATVLRATLNESNQFGIDFTILGGVDFENVGSTSNATTDLRTGQLPAAKFQDPTLNVNTSFTGNVTGGGFTFGVINNGVAAFIRALEEVTDVVVVANPKVVALNKQEGEVIVGRRDGYVTTTVTETAAIQSVEFLETGTQIKFRPMINEDGTVRLAVHPKDSNGGLTAANLPFEETTEAHSDLLVNDGDTALIGGLFRERTVSSKSQIPLIGDIPLAGLAFGSRNDQTIREEVIILLTVHIIKDNAEERAKNEDLLEDVERIRVGARAGLLGSGRERLAQAHFHAALADLDAGRRGCAVLNLRMTLHNQPKHIAALKLLERLLRERQWDDEGTRMRTLVWDLLQAEHPDGGTTERAFGRPRLDADPPAAPADGDEGTQP